MWPEEQKGVLRCNMGFYNCVRGHLASIELNSGKSPLAIVTLFFCGGGYFFICLFLISTCTLLYFHCGF